ncbi:MAG: TRAP transporter small permease [Planctomycetes bacterium]|nr:TRAP transporter small permease [Planctomycetota bacterium]
MNNPQENPVRAILEPVGRVAAILCGYIVLLISFAITAEIILRKLFTYSLHGIDDIGGYVLAATASIGAAYTLTLFGHTRVDIFLNMFSDKTQRLLNLIAMLIFNFFSLFLAWRGTVVLLESIYFQSMATNPLRTPMWQPQIVWLAGLYLMALVSVAYLIHAAILFAKGSPMLNIWYGTASAQSEAEVTVLESIDG